MNENREEMVTLAVDASHTVGTLSQCYPTDDFTMSMMLSILCGPTDHQILLTNAEGRVMSCSEAPDVCTHYNAVISDNMLNRLYTSTSPFEGISDMGGIYSSDKYVVASPVTNHNRISGYILVSTDPAEMAQMWRRSSGMLALVAVAPAVGNTESKA